MTIIDELSKVRAELEAYKQKYEAAAPPVLLESSYDPDELAEMRVAASYRAPPPIIVPAPALRLDLGSGPRPADGFKGVDVVDGITDFCVDLSDGAPWPFEDDSVDELRSSHFIEHIRNDYFMQPVPAYKGDKGFGRALPKDLLFHFFDEAFRIIKPGGTFTIQWPALQSVRAFQDPTHRRFIPAETMNYLHRGIREQMGLAHYNVKCNWITVSCAPTIDMAWGQRAAEVQQVKYREAWNFSSDFIAVLKADKGDKK